jgi:hypothetical protein
VAVQIFSSRLLHQIQIVGVGERKTATQHDATNRSQHDVFSTKLIKPANASRRPSHAETFQTRWKMSALQRVDAITAMLVGAPLFVKTPLKLFGYEQWIPQLR